MTGTTLILLSASYVAVAALLLSLNVASAWRWQIKIAGIIIVSALYVGTYLGAKELLGWPSGTAMPDYFRLHWAIVTEPDKFTGEDGRILVWAEQLDDKDQSLAPPRAYRLAYDDELARRIEHALGLVSEGQAITGSLNTKTDSDEAEDSDQAADGSEADSGQSDGSFQAIGAPPDLHFEQMRPPERPAKRAL
ncbi:MAG: hypothetical protein HQ511_11785 [Rhodospirillales bacterium]|nr:hypothetical protein [Rhodospirillales bacterium]